MNAGLNLLTALFLLAPGFGVFAGVYLTSLRRPFRPAPAAPGSLLALALITIGALVAHGLSSIPYALQDIGCAQWTCLAVSFEPNPYITLIDPRGATHQPSLSLTIALVHLVVVSAMGLFIGWGGMAVASRFKAFQTLFYGWTLELTDRAPTRFHVINAFAVTDVSNDDSNLGYEGTLLDLRQDSGGKLLSATLRDVQAFVLVLKDGAVERKKVDREAPIPFMVLEAENVKNVALAVYFDAKAASAISEGEIQTMTTEERTALRKALEDTQSKTPPSNTPGPATAPHTDAPAPPVKESETPPPEQADSTATRPENVAASAEKPPRPRRPNPAKKTS